VKLRLAGRRSPNWAILERFEVPNLDDPRQTYLTRWRLIQTPWFGVYLHRMDGPDSRPTLHDHPWEFASIILRGGYREVYNAEPARSALTDDYRIHRAGDVNRLHVTDGHYIRELFRVPTWTLMLVGRRQRTWGYWDDESGYRDRSWTPFDVHHHAAEFDAAMAERARLGLTRRPWWKRQQARQAAS